ncbi:MAG TPA: MBL fold metallo-hydrolase [Acidimicrobiales bacterium]|nr:MBL fold metallo-hydrolase [Acidimicrobiales bacterium]
MTAGPAVRLTHLGGPTVLVEVAGWRILTDPTFDPPGRRYRFGWGTASTKLGAPARAATDVGPVDAVLLTHDHHADNLDDAGRALLAGAPAVVTTRSGAGRLGGVAQGLVAGGRVVLSGDGRPDVTVTATPCRHGPPLSRPIVGDVVGFALTWPGQRRGALWVSGDTVLHRDLLRLADRMPVGVALLHLGGVRFPVTGPLRYTMTARDAVRLCGRLRPAVAFPVHYEGWSHFVEGRPAIERRLAAAPPEVRDAVRWLPIGEPTEVDA